MGPTALAFIRRLIGADRCRGCAPAGLPRGLAVRRAIRPTQRLEAWLLDIARKRSIDHLRRQSRRREDVESVVDAAEAIDVVQFADRYVDAATVRQALAELSDVERESLGARLLRAVVASGDRQPARRAARHGEGACVPRLAEPLGGYWRRRRGDERPRRAGGRWWSSPDDLPALVAGTLELADVRRIIAHLRTCDPCRRELVEVVGATAALELLRTFDERGLDDLTPDEDVVLPTLALGKLTSVATPSPGDDAEDGARRARWCRTGRRAVGPWSRRWRQPPSPPSSPSRSLSPGARARRRSVSRSGLVGRRPAVVGSR